MTSYLARIVQTVLPPVAAGPRPAAQFNSTLSLTAMPETPAAAIEPAGPALASPTVGAPDPVRMAASQPPATPAPIPLETKPEITAGPVLALASMRSEPEIEGLRPVVPVPPVVTTSRGIAPVVSAPAGGMVQPEAAALTQIQPAAGALPRPLVREAVWPVPVGGSELVGSAGTPQPQRVAAPVVLSAAEKIQPAPGPDRLPAAAVGGAPRVEVSHGPAKSQGVPGPAAFPAPLTMPEPVAPLLTLGRRPRPIPAATLSQPVHKPTAPPPSVPPPLPPTARPAVIASQPAAGPLRLETRPAKPEASLHIGQIDVTVVNQPAGPSVRRAPLPKPAAGAGVTGTSLAQRGLGWFHLKP